MKFNLNYWYIGWCCTFTNNSLLVKGRINFPWLTWMREKFEMWTMCTRYKRLCVNRKNLIWVIAKRDRAAARFLCCGMGQVSRQLNQKQPRPGVKFCQRKSWKCDKVLEFHVISTELAGFFNFADVIQCFIWRSILPVTFDIRWSQR